MVPTEDYYSNLMTVNDYLDQEKLKSQSSIAMAWLGRHNEYLDNMRALYNAGADTDMLGKTYKGICQQCSGYVSVIDVLKTANDCDIADHEYMLAVLGAMTFDGSIIIPAAIEAHKNEDDERAAAASDRSAAASTDDPQMRDMYNTSASSHDKAADTYRAEWELLEKYMRRFHRVNEKTKDLFTLGNEYRIVARNGLESIAWTFNSKTNEYATADDTWKNDLKTLDEKLYQVYVSHAKEIGESWSLEDACKIIQKDADKISVQEYMALCYAYDAMEPDEKEIFLESSYIPTDETFVSSTGYASTRKCSVSFTMQLFTAVYGKTMSVRFDESGNPYNADVNRISTDEQLLNYNLLYTVSYITPDIYVGGNKYSKDEDLKCNIEIIEQGNGEHQITIDAYNSAYVTAPIGTIISSVGYTQTYTICPYSHNLDAKIDDAVMGKIDGTFRSNFSADVTSTIATNVWDTAVDPCLNAVGGLAYTASETIISLGNDYIEGVENDQVLDEARSNLDLGNMLEGYGCGATLIFDDNNNVYVPLYYYDEEELEEYIEEYNEIQTEEKSNNARSEVYNDEVVSTLTNAIMGKYDENTKVDRFINYMTEKRNSN